MSISASGNQLRKLINKAIEDCIITPDEYNEIINLSLQDGFIDSQEHVLLRELQKMIENKDVRFSNK